jgi:hypothetical protein
VKKFLGLALSGLLAVSLLGPASAAGKKQTVDGLIALPAPYTDDSGCFAGIDRRLAMLTMGQENGVFGYHFDVDKATWNKPFYVAPTSAAAGDADIDILFYLAEFGSPDLVASDPTGAGAPPSVDFKTREAGGEAGVVPKTAVKAIACVYGGQLGASGGVNFHYEAGKGVKAPK